MTWQSEPGGRKPYPQFIWMVSGKCRSSTKISPAVGGGGGDKKNFYDLPAFLIWSTTKSAALPDCPSPLLDPPRSLTTTLAPRDAKSIAYDFPRPEIQIGT